MVLWKHCPTLSLALLCIYITFVGQTESSPAIYILDDNDVTADTQAERLQSFLDMLKQKQEANTLAQERPVPDTPSGNESSNADQGKVFKRLCPKGYFSNPFHSCKKKLMRYRGRKHRG